LKFGEGWAAVGTLVMVGMAVPGNWPAPESAGPPAAQYSPKLNTTPATRNVLRIEDAFLTPKYTRNG
jgi:hypothetical protein